MSISKITIKAVIVLLVLTSTWFAYSYYKSSDLGDKEVSIIIRPGDSFQKVAKQLTENKVVSGQFVLKVAAKIRKVDVSLIPGLYQFSSENSIASVLDKLSAGLFERFKVTIYEGAPIWKVASVLSEIMKVDSSQLIALNSDTTFLKKYNLPSLEGYLFPQTYFFPYGISLENIIDEMIAMYHFQTDSLMKAVYPNNLTKKEIMVMASIIEAEAMDGNEKDTIASVYHNRIKRKMKLQADPTVIYALGGLDRPLYLKDLKYDSPFNTYFYHGLPPTPINSPGYEAIKAAIYPEDTDYLYFVADGSGKHIFSRTNSEHNRARRMIKNNNSK